MMSLRGYIEANSIPEPNSGCWLWVGALNPGGYGVAHVNTVSKSAHRVSYQAFIGPIPKGLCLDHLCRLRCCVNPAHLEPVTQSENLKRSPLIGVKRMTECRNGHPYSGNNLYIDPSSGFRRCLTCWNALRRKIKERGSATVKNGVIAGASKRPSGWAAQITKNRKNIYLGTFKSKDEAGAAYLRARKILNEGGQL